MTFQQIDYLIAVAEAGSISAAAKKLFLTQSDISTVIKKIEQEFNIMIFARTPTGVVLTEDGREFIKYARQIRGSYGKMSQIGRQSHLQFAVVSTGLTCFNNAFYQLCSLYTDYPEYSFDYLFQSVDRCLQMVQSRQVQVMAVSELPSARARRAGQIQKSGMESEYLGSLTVNICCRRSHPLLQGLPEGAPFPFGGLADYPLVDYPVTSLRELTADKSRKVLPFVPKRTIRVMDVSHKDRILSCTDAYMIGAARPRKTLEKKGLYTYPIPDCWMDLNVYYYKDSPEWFLIDRYVQLVKEELAREMSADDLVQR